MVALLYLHPLEHHSALVVAGEVGVDAVERGDAVDVCRGADEVGPLDELEPWLLQPQERRVERAVLVGDQHDALQSVNLDEEFQLVGDADLFKVCLGVAGEAGGAAGERDAVIAGEGEPLLEEVVEVLAEAAVGAVDRRGTDAGGVVGE